MRELIGCGIDIEEPARFTKHIPESNLIPGFLKQIFTEEEISRNLEMLPHLSFPIGFACKEACFKAFGVSWTNSPISWKDISIFFTNKDDLREHSILLEGYALELFKEKKCRKIESHLDYTEDYVIFEILLLT